MNPTTRYARADNVHVAYQVFGAGLDLVFVPGFVSHIDNYWDDPRFSRMLERLGSFARVLMFDKRGTGLSSRVSTLPTMDKRMDDVRAVMDAEGIERAAIFGVSEGGSLATLFAAHHPDRCTALVLYGAFARFSSWLATDEEFEEFLVYVDTSWGSGKSLPLFAPGAADEADMMVWWGKFERLGGDPRAVTELMEMNRQIDISDVLGAVQVPTLVIHRHDDMLIDFEAGQMLADRIPGARLVDLPGEDHLLSVGDNAGQILDEIEVFLTGQRTLPTGESVLATVLFTDIVDSTARAHALGDERWGDLLDAHNRVVRAQLERFRGREIKLLGDGFLATFDGPARAIRCAVEITRAVRPIGLQVRAGLHTGEVRFAGGDVEGMAVNIAARVSAIAGASDVLISRTVKDLVAGSGITLADAGVHSFKGIPEQWQLYAAVT